MRERRVGVDGSTEPSKESAGLSLISGPSHAYHTFPSHAVQPPHKARFFLVASSCHWDPLGDQVLVTLQRCRPCGALHSTEQGPWYQKELVGTLVLALSRVALESKLSEPQGHHLSKGLTLAVRVTQDGMGHMSGAGEGLHEYAPQSWPPWKSFLLLPAPRQIRSQ